MTALYNEIDPKAAAWLRELITQGHIAPGIVDERSIEDLDPEYLRQFTQVHFFAGIGVWSRALRDAGWPDDRPVWTGSCPCQPFSAAGKGGGFDDERHLWPAFHWLIEQCRPDIVLGEQVASKDGLAWLDLVSSDLEASGYAAGAVDTCAAGFGAPHIRQRLWWVGLADAERVSGRSKSQAADLRQPETDRSPDRAGRYSRASRSVALPHDAERRADLSGRHEPDGPDAGRAQGAGHAGSGGAGGRMADSSDGHGWSGERSEEAGTRSDQVGRRGSASGCLDDRVADNACGRRGEERPHGRGLVVGDRTQGLAAGSLDGGGDFRRPCPTNGFWRAADWLGCRDARWRPVEPGTFPLAHGAAARVGRLRGYGNAIVAPQAQAFAEAVIEWRAASDLC